MLNSEHNSRLVHTYYNTSLIFLIGLLLSGCIESIDFDTERTGNQLVVDGRITNKPGPHQLKLSITGQDNNTPLPVSGATVILFDDMGNSEPYIEDSEGVYLYYGHSIQAVPGHSYHIEIQLPDGRTYQSRPELMPTVIARDSVYYKIGTIEEVRGGHVYENESIEIFFDSDIPRSTDPLFLRWSVHGLFKFTEYDYPDPFHAPPAFCYAYHFPNPQKISLFSSENSDANRIDSQLLAAKKIDFTFYQRHYFNVVQTSVTRGAYRYWEQADQVINSIGTIFDVPPALPRGNVFNINNSEDVALGYFEAALTDTVRFFTLRGDFPVYLGNPCARPYGNLHPACYNCQELPHSTKEEPFYWLQD